MFAILLAGKININSVNIIEIVTFIFFIISQNFATKYILYE